MTVFAFKTVYLSFIVYILQTGRSSSAETYLGALGSAALWELNALRESLWSWCVQGHSWDGTTQDTSLPHGHLGISPGLAPVSGT